jgi:hypothetical protein
MRTDRRKQPNVVVVRRRRHRQVDAPHRNAGKTEPAGNIGRGPGSSAATDAPWEPFPAHSDPPPWVWML